MKIEIVERKIVEYLDAYGNCVVKKNMLDRLSQGVKDLLNACVGKYEGKNTIIFDKHCEVPNVKLNGEGWLY